MHRAAGRLSSPKDRSSSRPSLAPGRRRLQSSGPALDGRSRVRPGAQGARRPSMGALLADPSRPRVWAIGSLLALSKRLQLCIGYHLFP